MGGQEKKGQKSEIHPSLTKGIRPKKNQLGGRKGKKIRKRIPRRRDEW